MLVPHVQGDNSVLSWKWECCHSALLASQGAGQGLGVLLSAVWLGPAQDAMLQVRTPALTVPSAQHTD